MKRDRNSPTSSQSVARQEQEGVGRGPSKAIDMLIVNQPGLKVDQLAVKRLTKFVVKHKCACGGTFRKHGSYKRNVVEEDKVFEVLVPRVRGKDCGKIHGLLPASQNATKKQIEDFIIQSIVRPIGELGADISGGQRKKLRLAWLLLNKTSLIILDEPTANLARESKNRFMDFLKKSTALKIIITHDSELLDLADKTYTL